MWLLRRRYRSRHVRLCSNHRGSSTITTQYPSRALHIPASVSESISSVPANTLDSNSKCERLVMLAPCLINSCFASASDLSAFVFLKESYLFTWLKWQIFFTPSFIEWPWMDNSSNLPFCLRRTFFSICWAYIFDLGQIIYLRIIGDNVRNTGIE